MEQCSQETLSTCNYEDDDFEHSEYWRAGKISSEGLDLSMSP